MRLNLASWVTWYFFSFCLVHSCLTAITPNGVHDLDNFTLQEPGQSKNSPLHGNRLVNRALRINAPTPRLHLVQKSSLPSLNKSTTTTPTPVEYEDAYKNAAESQYFENEEDYATQPKEDSASSTTTSFSTEATRKPFGGVIRPFRSNKDLLDSLKRRRQMQQAHGSTVLPPTHPSTTSEKPTLKSTVRKNSNNVNAKSGVNSSGDHASYHLQKKATTRGRFNTRTSAAEATPTTPINDAVTEDSSVVSQPSVRSSRTYPKIRRT